MSPGRARWASDFAVAQAEAVAAEEAAGLEEDGVAVEQGGGLGGQGPVVSEHGFRVAGFGTEAVCRVGVVEMIGVGDDVGVVGGEPALGDEGVGKFLLGAQGQKKLEVAAGDGASGRGTIRRGAGGMHGAWPHSRWRWASGVGARGVGASRVAGAMPRVAGVAWACAAGADEEVLGEAGVQTPAFERECLLPVEGKAEHLGAIGAGVGIDPRDGGEVADVGKIGMLHGVGLGCASIAGQGLRVATAVLGKQQAQRDGRRPAGFESGACCGVSFGGKIGWGDFFAMQRL